MFPTFQSKKKFIATILLSLQMFTLVSVPLFVPARVAYAADVVDAVGAEGVSDSTTGAAPVKPPKSLGGWLIDNTFGALLAGIGFLFFQVAGKFCELMAYVLDMSIDKTIDKATYSGLNVIQVGWTAIRDISNMFFIFVLLYIAILTILGLAGSNTKKWVAHLIIAAVLINFSLFATQVVVDAGNILTKGFWSQMQTTQASGTAKGFAPIIFEGLKAQTIFNKSGTDFIDDAKVFFGGALIMFIAGYVLLAGAIMMIIRTVTLLILMIVSPFAFLGFGLPKGGGFATMWLNKLLGATFVAPVFVMMLYINMMIIRSTDIVQFGGAGGSQFSSALTGEVNNFAIFYNFFIMIVLLLASLTVSQSVSNGVGAKAGAWAKTAIGGGIAGGIATAGYAYRNTRGRYATNQLNNKQLQEEAKLNNRTGVQARAKLEKYDRISKRTGDLRNAPVLGAGISKALGYGGVSIGAGSKASAYQRKEAIEKNENDEIERAKRLFPNNPAAQQQYLKDRLGTQVGADKSIATKLGLNKDLQTGYGEGRHKKMSSALDQEVKNQEAKDVVNNSSDLKKELDKKIAENRITPENAKLEGEAIAKGVRDAMATLNSNTRAEMAEKNMNNEYFHANLNKGDLASIHRYELEGKYTEPVLQRVSENVMRGGNSDLQAYLQNSETQDRLFMIDYNKIQSDPSLMANYEKKRAQLEFEKSRIKDVAKAQVEANKENADYDLLHSIPNT